MKKFLFLAALVISSAAISDNLIVIDRINNGSGTPGQAGIENAVIVDNAKVENNILHAPQYMAGFPTAATIWPRVIEVDCKKNAQSNTKCNGYEWSPAMGRGEYLFIKTKVAEEPKVAPVPPVVPVIETTKKKIGG